MLHSAWPMQPTRLPSWPVLKAAPPHCAGALPALQQSLVPCRSAISLSLAGLSTVACVSLRRWRAQSRWRYRRHSCGGIQRGAAAAETDTIDDEFSYEAMQASRPAHWSVRTTDLKRSLQFLETVCGMKVLRHEEHNSQCSMTSNGAYDTPWSKTIVGYRSEDKGFALELTYNYGVGSYKSGTGLEHFAIGVDDPTAALNAASALGYSSEGDILTGPDGYQFRILPPMRSEERFLYVALRVKELPKAVQFYGDVLGMNDLTFDYEYLAFTRGGSDLMRVVGYNDDQVPLMLFEDPFASEELKLEDWEGRHTLRVPADALQGTYNELEKMHGAKSIAHKLQEHDDKLGKMTAAVVRDMDGYEICLVNSDEFNNAAQAAARATQEIDWTWRETAHKGP